MATDAQAPNPPRLAADRARRLWLARLASGWKEPVYVATTANVTLSNVQAIDGVAVPDGARVLVKDQTAAAENGIYEAKYGTWLRTSDADHADKLGAATKVAVQRGTTNGGTTWRLTTTAAITLGTTALAWAADGGSGGGTAATTTFTPAAGIAATDVQAAIVELVADVAASYQPLDSDLTAIAALSTTSFGRSLLALANAAALSAAAAAATTSAQGAVELATTAETQTGTDTTRAVTPAGASGTYPTFDEAIFESQVFS